MDTEKLRHALKYKSNTNSNLIYNFLDKETSVSEFHNRKNLNTKKIEEFKRSLDLYTKVKSTSDNNSYVSNNTFLKKLIKDHFSNEDILVCEIGGSSHQYRNGNMVETFTNYLPLNINSHSIKDYTLKYKKPGVICDAEDLPFKDNSIDCIFTFATLEHIENPDVVIKEIIRVLKPNGLVFHNDAWFCRWWQRFGFVGLKSVSKMSSREKAIYFIAQLTEFPLIRFPPIILKRFILESFPRLFLKELRFKRLKPNFDLDLGVDEHATVSLDPMDIARFYEKNGFVFYNEHSFFQRIFFKKHNIAMIKD